MTDLVELLSSARAYDLAQPYFIGMPHHPVHPAYMFSLMKKHGDYVTRDGVSSASESLGLGGHVGTHIDALCHFSCGGNLHDGTVAASVQSYATGVDRLSVDTIAPIFRRGVLLDVAGHEKTDALPVDFTITPEHLDAVAKAEGVEVRARRRGSAAHRLGAILGGCGALHLPGEGARSRRSRARAG